MSKEHHTPNGRIGVLCVNLGTPQAPTHRAIRSFLKQFLSDRRVIHTPKWLWWWILHLFILPFRPFAIAKQYQAIWTNEGSPLLVHSQNLVQKLQLQLESSNPGRYTCACAMRYGSPSIEAALLKFQQDHIRNIIILPLFPQYSATTTASVYDAVNHFYRSQSFLPKLTFIPHYADHPDYISALCNSFKKQRPKTGKPAHLLISFHGIPQQYFDKGDPYYCYCHKTSRLIKEKLKLTDQEATMVFQSRFGPSQWLEPACDKTIEGLAKNGIKHLDVICPGFSADCLETLEEINTTYRNLFIENGGDSFHYIPALNDSDEHCLALAKLVTAL